MSDKEAKLAAARKRAEALKAKKSKKNETEKSEEVEASTGSVVVAAEVDEESKRIDQHDSSINQNSDLQDEIERLQGLLDESTSQQETLNKNLQEATKQNRDLEKDFKARIADLEGSLSRRDDHVQTLEMDLSNLRKEKETSTAELKEIQAQLDASKAQLGAVEKQPDLHAELDEVKKQLADAKKANEESDKVVKSLAEASSKADEKTKDLESKLEEALAQQAAKNGATSPRETEIQGKADVLLSENQNLLSQLSELRTHLISVQDEKFALVETVERLQKEVKEAKASKGKSSSDVPRARLSRDFDRSISMQDVSLDEKMTPPSRNPAEPPAELRSNIEIDLTSWYDKHAGEVIEV